MGIPSEQKRVMQVCWVVPDIESAIKGWAETMGIGPFFLFRDLEIQTIKHRGVPTRVKFHLALAQAGDVQIELAQQLSTATYAYSEMFPIGSDGGMHHIAIYVADYEAAMAHFIRQGFEPSVEGLFDPMKFAYVDTRRTLGCMVEVIEQIPGQDRLFAKIREVAERWDGITDPVR